MYKSEIIGKIPSDFMLETRRDLSVCTPDIQLHNLLEGEKQASQPVMPEGIGLLESGALFEITLQIK